MRCKFTHANGKECTLNAGRNSEYCWFHDPRLAEQRFKAQSRGGRGRRRKREVLYDIKFNLRDLHQLPFVIDDALDLMLHKMLSPAEMESVRRMAESAMRAHKLVSLDAKVDELLRRLKTARDRPVEQAEVDELLRFAPDDSGEIVQSITDMRDDGGPQNGDDDARRQNGEAVHREPGDHAVALRGQGDAEAAPHRGDARAGGRNDCVQDGRHPGDAEADRQDHVPEGGGPNGDPKQ
jgi:hypothetical protein